MAATVYFVGCAQIACYVVTRRCLLSPVVLGVPSWYQCISLGAYCAGHVHRPFSAVVWAWSNQSVGTKVRSAISVNSVITKFRVMDDWRGGNWAAASRRSAQPCVGNLRLQQLALGAYPALRITATHAQTIALGITRSLCRQVNIYIELDIMAYW